MMDKTASRSLDHEVLRAQFAFWLLALLTLYSVFKDVKDFGQAADIPADIGWFKLVVAGLVFFRLFMLVWENTRVPWRTPVIGVLAALMLYDAYIIVAVGYDQRDMTRLTLDAGWLMLLASLYDFRPLFKSES